MSDFDYHPTTIGRVMSRVRSDLHGPDRAAPAATGVREDGRAMSDAIAQVPVFNPPLAIDLQGKTIFLGDQTGVAPKSAVATTAPSVATAKPLHEGAVRAEIGRVSAQLGDPHLPQNDASRPPLRELLDLLQGVDAILRAGMQPALETAARIEELRASTAVRSLSDYKDPELRAALASTRLERDHTGSNRPGSAVLLQQRLKALEREGERRWGDSEPCLEARATLVPESQLPRVLYSPEELLSCTGPVGACASVDQVARIEARRQDECAWTGVDPLRFADMANGEPTADVDNGAAKVERNTQKWLEIIASETRNPLAAMAVVGSAATGSSVDVTANRVQFADAAAGVLGSMGMAAAQRAPVSPPAVRGMRRPTSGPGLGPRARAIASEHLTRAAPTKPSTFGPAHTDGSSATIGPPRISLEEVPGVVRVLGDSEASYAVDAKGAPLLARGELEGPHPGRPKGYRPEPIGGRLPGDHRGHLIAEGTARDPSKVNVRSNLIAEAQHSNLSPKKRFESLATEIKLTHPGQVVETEHFPIRIPGNLRPVAVRHRILVDGVEVHSEVIENK